MTADRIDVYDLPQRVEVWRPQLTDDGQGGQSEAFVQVGVAAIPAKVNEPTAAERIEAMRSGVDLTHVVHLLPDADVERADELRVSGDVLRVKSTTYPSTRMYLRAQCERDQTEQG